jgi:integrase
MARARTGTLIYKRTTGWNARVWTVVRAADGTERDERRWVPLETQDKDLAKRKLAKIVGMLASGELVADAARAEAVRVDTVEVSAREWCKRRKASGIEMADTELGYFVHHVFKEIGPMLVTDVRKANVKGVLQAAITKGMSEGTIGHLRRMLSRFFKSLEVDEIIPSNPVRLVELKDLGRMKKDKRPFTLPTDAEVTATFESPAVDIEIKIVILVARMLGGQRGAEVNRWTWEMIDRRSFASCVIQRAKGDDVQALTVPETLRPFLRAWWEGNGAPASGPVFPVARGLRRGEARGKTSYAARVRRAFWNAGQRRPELHEDTPHSRPLNFHTMGRRAFVSALAASGANEQTAMALAHHADSRVHKRYQLGQIVDVPVAALPALGTATPAGWVTAVSKRSRRSELSVERDTRFELATSSLGSWHSTN